ncbi:hypothetical protein [Cupriavidus campinensis]|uniref:hypothetical protein n=1 Tax=Cupriavidus campinensis TaxID=151783 RepID=UPI0016425D1D|nr:hypothetical protein [Cupriavidus campinensis]
MPACGGASAGVQPVSVGNSAEQAMAAEKPAPTCRNARRDGLEGLDGLDGLDGLEDLEGRWARGGAVVAGRGMRCLRLFLLSLRCDSAEAAENNFDFPFGFKRADDSRTHCCAHRCVAVSCDG